MFLKPRPMSTTATPARGSRQEERGKGIKRGEERKETREKKE
jgi:hypothetical protein